MARGSRVDSQSAGGSQNRTGGASPNRGVAQRERAGRAQRGPGTTRGYRHERAGAEGRGPRRSEELAALQQITSAIQSSLQPGPILQQMADGIVHLLDYDAAVIFLLNGTEQVFRASAICSRDHILPRIKAMRVKVTT